MLMRVTLADVAREAGVSVVTVSRVINDTYPEKVSEKTRQRVLETVARMNYKPNVMARGLQKGRTFLIGVAIVRVADSFFGEILQGIHDAAAAADLGVLLGTRRLDIGKDKSALRELQQVIGRVNVFARVQPEHKVRIVRALKAKGEIVGMTGDGVNDGPAVKEADIGISMGKTGTDVTKEASDIVLADDNFATIVAAIEEGRVIYDNIRKFIRYLLGCNVGEVLTMLLATVVGLPLPLLPIQILWMNLVTDGLPAIALSVDPGDVDIMDRNPRSPQEGIFARGLHLRIASQGLLIGVCTLVVYALELFLGSESLESAQTMAFTTLVISQLIFVFQCRSEEHRVWEVGIFGNLWLLGAVLVSMTMHLGVLYIPILQPIFKTVPLVFGQWALVLFFSGGSIIFTDIVLAIYQHARRRLAWIRV